MSVAMPACSRATWIANFKAAPPLSGNVASSGRTARSVVRRRTAVTVLLPSAWCKYVDKVAGPHVVLRHGADRTTTAGRNQPGRSRPSSMGLARCLARRRTLDPLARQANKPSPANRLRICSWRACSAARLAPRGRRRPRKRGGSVTAGLPSGTPKSILTLSEVGELGHHADLTTQAARTATARPSAALRGSTARTEPVTHIRAELRRIRTARRTGANRTARVHLDRLIDYVWMSGPEDAA
jgi:hypothetical protein